MGVEDGDSSKTTTPTTTPSPPNTFHPAYDVTNVKNLMGVTLDSEDNQYLTWCELFTIQACASNVLDHIDESVSRPEGVDDATWRRLDAIVKQWIYGTISKDLVNTIMIPGATALTLWKRLAQIFQDNKDTRATLLGRKLKNIRFESFANISDYCRELKLLSDQLANVGQPISGDQLVIQMVAGLPKGDFDVAGSMILQSEPLPSFDKACSRLLLEETRRSMQTDDAPTTLVAPSTTGGEQQKSPAQQQPQNNNQGGGRGGNKENGGNGRGRGNGRSGRGRGRDSQRNAGRQQPAQNYWAPPQWNSNQQWPNPPCPYPTYGPGLQQPTRQGILGSGPRSPAQQQQAFLTPQPGYAYGPAMTPTDLGNAFSSMNIQQPDDGWYMDTGASNHLTNNAGSSYGENSHEMQ